MSELTITSITYNVNSQKCTKESLERWMEYEEGLEKSQIVCIALQELAHVEILTNSSWTDNFTSWMSRHRLVLVNRLYLASNLLLIYCAKSILPMINYVNTRWCRNSLFGLMGYKGTISTRLILKDGTALIFITSHFIHGEKYFKERIKQYSYSLSCTFNDARNKSVEDKSIVIWSGDLNSRVEGFTNSSDMIDQLNKCTDTNELAKIVDAFDQLRKSMRNKEAFHEFNEFPIHFKPSYRILVGSGSYDPLRIPSWCDRILFKSRDNALQAKRYSSYQKITISDHFPVSAKFLLKYLNISNGEWNCVFDEIPTWEQHIPLICRISFPSNFWARNGSYLDWVGVYPETIGAVSQPIIWIYLLWSCYDDQRKTIIEFSALAPGKYKVGYFSYRQNCLQGLSNSFSVREVVERI